MLGEEATIVYATIGAATLQGLILYEKLIKWQAARLKARVDGNTAEPGPRLAQFVDPTADTVVAIVTCLLGALAGRLLSGEIGGVPLALVAGAAAPELLMQLLRNTALSSMALKALNSGTPGTPPPHSGTTDPTTSAPAADDHAASGGGRGA